MSRELKTVLFIIAGVLVNLLVMGAVFLVLIFVLARFLAPVVPEAIGQLLLVAALLGSVSVGLYVYSRLYHWLKTKLDFSRHFIHSDGAE